MRKANKDGWVRHRGGKSPVSENQAVEYRMRSGLVKQTATGGLLCWDHGAWPSDIMAYRVISNDERAFDACVNKCASTEPGEPEMPAAKYFDGPLQWRDRIFELDAEQKAADEAHKAASEARAAERASLVAKLKAEGFALLGDAEKSDSAPEEDMTDPANWRAGDLFVIVKNKNDDHEFEEGTIVRFTSNDDGADGYAGAFESQDGRDYWFCKKESVKFHSRPTT